MKQLPRRNLISPLFSGAITFFRGDSPIFLLYEGIGILVCTETWLHDAIPNHLVEIPSMNLFRYDRDNGKLDGSVACYVNKTLKLKVNIISNFTHISTDLGIMTLKCAYLNGKSFHIVAVYRPPNGSYLEFFDHLTDHIGSFLNNKDLYICGDFNIDYLHRNNPKTKALISFLYTFGLKQHIKDATRLTGFSKSCIDFIISNISDSRSNEVLGKCDFPLGMHWYSREIQEGMYLSSVA